MAMSMMAGESTTPPLPKAPSLETYKTGQIRRRNPRLHQTLLPECGKIKLRVHVTRGQRLALCPGEQE